VSINEIINILNKDFELPFNLGNTKDYREMIINNEIHYDILDQKLLLNYSQNIFYQKKKVNKNIWKARGLILNLEHFKNNRLNLIEALPFIDFTGIEQIKENEIKDITVKYDGALVISFWDKDNISWCTRKYFNSKIAKNVNNYWRSNHIENQHLIPKNITILCEYIHPTLTRILIPYSKEKLIILAAFDKNTGEEMEREYLDYLGKILGIKVAESVSLTLSDVLKKVENFTTEQEGYIIKIKNGKRIKVSNKIYNAVYDILSFPSIWMISEIWCDWDSANQLLDFLPQEIKEIVLKIFNELDFLFMLNRSLNKVDTVLKYRNSKKDIYVPLMKYLESDL